MQKKLNVLIIEFFTSHWLVNYIEDEAIVLCVPFPYLYELRRPNGVELVLGYSSGDSVSFRNEIFIES